MKRFIALILSCVLILSLIGCCEQTTVSVNVENKDDLSNTGFGRSVMVEIGDGLWYDSTTRIVYQWNGILSASAYSSTTPTAYYAPNGLPYRYNPETNTFEEIEEVPNA